MKKVKASLGILGVTALAVGALLIAPHLALSSLPTESPAKVRLTQVAVGDVEQMLAVSGRVRFESEYAAISPATGVVAQVYVKAGDAVTAGQPLFRLDSQAQEMALSAAFAQGEQTQEAVTVSTAAGDVDLSPLRQLTAQEKTSAVAEGALALEAMTVRAAADGRVQQVSVSQMGGVMAGSPAMTLSGDKQKIVCSVVIRDAEKLHKGLSARVLSGGVTACTATVADIGAATTDTLTGQTVAEVSLTPEHNLDLPLGAPVDVEIVLSGASGVPMLPVTAVTDEGTVWWVADGRCWETPANVLLSDEVNCQVSLPDGLTVVDSAAGLIEGQKVKEMKP